MVFRVRRCAVRSAGRKAQTLRNSAPNVAARCSVAVQNAAAENKPTSKFCEECGTALDGHAASAATSSAQAASTTPNIRVTPEQSAGDPLDGERKTVTALFADIKGSMELMEDLDPEEARAIVDPALKLMIDAVHRYDGYVVQSTGDGIFALFGAPVAHEDHPQRALYAALRMQEEMSRYSGEVARGGQAATRGSRWRQYRRSRGAFDQDRRRAYRVHADWPFDQPGVADADAGADRLDRSHREHCEALRRILRVQGARARTGQGCQRAGSAFTR